MPTFPFEVAFEDILKDPESYVDAVFSCLESEFLIMPKGAGFVEYSAFEYGYEALKTATKGFSKFEPAAVLPVILREPIAIVVLRTMLEKRHPYCNRQIAFHPIFQDVTGKARIEKRRFLEMYPHIF